MALCKKISAIILATVMALTTMPVGASEDAVKSVDTVINTESNEILADPEELLNEETVVEPLDMSADTEAELEEVSEKAVSESVGASDDIAGGVFDGVPWRITAEGELLIGRDGEEYTYTYTARKRNWPFTEDVYRNNIINVRFCGTVHGNGNHEAMFMWAGTLREFDGSNFDTSNVTVMEYMFNGCTGLKTLELSNWDTSSVTDMSYMFEGCSNLEILEVSKWDTSSVTDMSRMFHGCTSLKTLELSNWDTSSVTDMGYMFDDCLGLETLDVSHFDTSNVTSMHCMFDGCTSLETLDISRWNTSTVTDMVDMFYRCASLKNLEVSNWDTSNVESMFVMFGCCSSLETLDVSKWDTSNVTDMYQMFNGCTGLKTLEVSNWDTSSVTDMRYMFEECSNLEILEVSKWDTSSVTDMSHMFHGCTSLNTLELSNWDTSNVTVMEYMFHGCTGLETLELSNWDTSSVTNMSYMFEECSNLEILEVSNWDTSSVTDMHHMFAGCASLETIDVSNWDTSNVTDMYQMFNGCTNLKTLGVSNWNTANAKYMYGMFAGCASLETIDVSNWDTSNVYYMGHMFEECSSLKTLDVSNWDTSNVTDMSLMFYRCASLETLDVSNWNTSNVYYMGFILSGLNSLQTITFGPKFNLKDFDLNVGNWQREGDSKIYTAEELSSSYDAATMAGTYHRTDITIEKPLLEGEFNFTSDFLAKALFNDKTKPLTYTYEYDDSWLLGDTSAYNHDLAKISLRLAMAAYDSGISGDGAKYIKDFMRKLGYSYTDNSIHYPIPKRDTIGCAIGKKDISDDTSVILVAIRGGGYKSEWSSNATVGKEGDHQGFDEASVNVGDCLKTFFDENSSRMKSNVRVWIVGYSRAAATGNLLAADLNDGFIEGITKKDVFSYGFECPQGTINKEAQSKKYDNIKTIVNPIDLVPLVAMDWWGFRRYGVTYSIPSASRTSNYLDLKANMCTQYSNLLEYNGVIDTQERDELVENLTKESKGQANTFRDLSAALSYLGKDRTTYVANLQSKLREALAAGNDDADSLRLQIEILLASYQADLNCLDLYDRLLDTTRIFWGSGGKLSFSNLTHAHYAELCLSWLDSLDGGFVNFNGRYSKIFVNCPVNVAVYNTDGTQVASIIDGIAESSDICVDVYIDDNDQKTVIIPADADYTLLVTATDTGSVTYTAMEYEGESNTPQRIVSYENVELSKGEQMTGTVTMTESGETVDYSLIKGNEEPKLPIDLDESNIKQLQVEVSAEGSGNVTGGGIFFTNEYCLLTAEPQDYAVFKGWFLDGELISTEPQYRFIVKDDMKITGQFREETKPGKNNPFVDVAAGKFYYDPVLWAVEKKITSGTDATHFSPDADCTRGQVVTFLWRAAGSPKPATTKNPFTDVKAGKYYYEAVLWAVENNITAGLSTTIFGPDKPCTRGQVVTFLWRAKNKPASYADVSAFQDVKAGKYYYDPVRWAVKAGVTQGTSKTAFSPDGTCTRGQIVTFLYRAYQQQ